jgi:hypothetical protein
MNSRKEVEEKLQSVRDHVKELSGLFELIIDDLDKVFSRVFDINWELMDMPEPNEKPEPKPKPKPKPRTRTNAKKPKAKPLEISSESLNMESEETIQHL